MLPMADLKLLVCSSQEPDSKRQRVEENSTAGVAGQDMAANSAYNYNNWYQVRFISSHPMGIWVSFSQLPFYQMSIQGQVGG